MLALRHSVMRRISLAPYSTLGVKAAEEVSSKWKGTTANGGKTKNYIGGKFVDSTASRWLEVRDPVRRHVLPMC